MKNIKLLAIIFVASMLIMSCAVTNVSHDIPVDMPTETQPASETPTAVPSSTFTPRPTYTLTPLPEWILNFTEPILKAIADRPPTYEDDFSDPSSGWYSGKTDSDRDVKIIGEKRYDDGEYYVVAEGVTPNIPVVCTGVQDQNVGSYADFVAEFDVRFVSGYEGDWQLQFHGNKVGLYKIQLTRGGGIGFGKCGSGLDGCPGLGNIFGYSINGGNEWNHIQLIVRGSKMAAYVNSVPTLYADDTMATAEYTKGSFSINSCNFSSAPLETRWDNFRVWDISDLP